MAFTLTFISLSSLFTEAVNILGIVQRAANAPRKNFSPQVFFPPVCVVFFFFSFSPPFALHRRGHMHSTLRQSMELQRGAVILLVNVLCCVTACPQD